MGKTSKTGKELAGEGPAGTKKAGNGRVVTGPDGKGHAGNEEARNGQAVKGPAGHKQAEKKAGTALGVQKNIYALGLVSFFTDVSSEMIFPLMPIVMTTFLGAGKEIIGLMEGIADSMASLLDIFVGYFSDKKGERKKFVLAGYGLSALLKIGIAFSTVWQQIFIFRSLERVGKTIRTATR